MNGLILTGGQSTRMGQPKALLDYHGKLQWLWAAELLAPFCERVFISCRAEQEDLFAGFSTICDKKEFGDIGPMNGVLSAFFYGQDLQGLQDLKTYYSHHVNHVNPVKNSAWLVLACDYPLLEKSDLEQLVRARNPQYVATVFSNPESGKIEPLIGIYEAAAAPLLLEWQQVGNQSLRVFLERQATQIVVSQNPDRLKSVDTPEAFFEIKMKLPPVFPTDESVGCI